MLYQLLLKGSQLLSPKLSRAYRRLKAAEQIDWDSRCVLLCDKKRVCCAVLCQCVIVCAEQSKGCLCMHTGRLGLLGEEAHADEQHACADVVVWVVCARS